ncbi:2-hydroxyacid dehydrogenase [Pseudonocardia nigra]|uniref:2-hydroxyacid dehydrogenase n=1 Tax=Pseudonocardia nigra TaxID=1921578 RepID=UPI001FE5561C|nr:2-hydroxyacid dehydrogenase [Pseudonocardia nigra]
MSDRVELAAIGALRPAVLEALAAEFTLHEVGASADVAAALGPAAERVRGIVTSPMVGVSAPVMDALPKLEIVSLFGVGLERTDLTCARERGIVVTTTPVLYEDVADTAVVLAMDVSRRVTAGDRWLRAGSWAAGQQPASGSRFSGKRAGILGMGRIGRMLAKRLAAFDMKISYYDPRPAPDVDYPPYSTGVELARESDFLFLCAAGGPGQRHLVDGEMLAALGPQGVFVNISRGWLVDEEALVDAVVTGTIGGAGLDVFDDEPNVPQALREADNVVLLPHIASNTFETRQDMDRCMVDNIRSWFTTGQAITPVP